MPTIDERLIECNGENEIAENFNRVMALVDKALDALESQLFKVDFDSDGGSAVNTQFIIKGGKVTEPIDPTKAGYTFGGWLVGEGEEQEEYDFTKEVTSHLTLKAKWEEEPEPEPEPEGGGEQNG